MTTDYAAIAQAEITDFIQHSTRFDLGHIQFSEERGFIVEFRIDVQHHVKPNLSEETRPGRVAPDATDAKAESRVEYDRLAATVLREAGQRVDVIQMPTK